MEISNMDIQMFFIIFGISFSGFLCSLISLFIIYKKPTLHNAFGYICAAHSSAEGIMLFCFSFWSVPIILLNKDIGKSTFGIIIGPLMNYLLYGSLYFQSIKSLNRVFAIMFFSQYRKLFTVENVKIIFLFVAIASFFHIIPSFFYECNFYFDAYEYVWVVREDTCATTIFLYVDFGTGSITMSISVLCDCGTFVYLLNRKRSLQQNSSTSYSREIKFFIQTCLTSLFYTTLFISWHFVSRHLTTSVWSGFLSTTLIWQLCHALNQIWPLFFEIVFYFLKMYATWQLSVHACFGLFLFPLYIFVLINFLVPSLNQPFKSYFFKIATILGFVDIISYITVWIFVKLPACPLTYHLFLNSDKYYIFNILAFLRYYTSLVRCYLLVIGSANRFTALNYAIKHDKLWNKYGNFAILFCLVSPDLFTVERLFGVLYVYVVKEAVAIDATSDWILIDQSLIFAIHASITGLVTLILNMFSLRALMGQNISNGNFFSVEKHKLEKSLLIITFWDFIVDSFYIALNAWQVYRNIVGRTTQDDTPYILIIWILDFNNLFRPVILVLMCKALRKAFLKYVWCTEVSNVIIINTNTS